MSRTVREAIYVLAAVTVILIVAGAATGEAAYASTWPSYRGNDENNGVVQYDAKFPVTQLQTKEAWIRDLTPSSGSTNKVYIPNTPIIVNGDLVTASYKTIHRINAINGKTLVKGTLDYAASNSVPCTYAKLDDGSEVIFCPLSNGNIEALNANTLEKIWIFKPAEKDADGNYLWGLTPEMTMEEYKESHDGQDPPADLVTEDGNVLAKGARHQSLSPILYSDGMIYTGYKATSDTYFDYFVAIAACEMEGTDPVSGDTVQYHPGDMVWKYKAKGGFESDGAYDAGKSVVIGTQDGAESGNGDPIVVSIDKKTGEVIPDSEYVLTGAGDICSSIVCDKSGTGKIYWTSKGGFLFSAAVDPDTGKMTEVKSVELAGTNVSTVCTPVVYSGRVYITYKAKEVKGFFAAYKADNLGEVFKIDTECNSESSPLIVTSYESDTGYLYAYITSASKPGSVTVIKFQKDTWDISDAEQIETYLLFAANGYSAYGASSLIADDNGRLYYKSDRRTIFAVARSSKITLSAVTGLKLKPAGSKVTITYKKVKNATSYRILYRINETGSYKRLNTKKTKYVLKVKNPSVVTVKVKAEYKDAAKSLNGAYCAAQTIYSAKSAIKKLKAGKQSFTVKFSKHSICKGYQIQYSLKKSMKYAPTLTRYGATPVKYTVSYLQKRKTYYVRVRSFKLVGGYLSNGKWVGGTYQYGNWSKKKKVKTK